MSNEDQTKPERRAPRWMKVLLVISLAFNLLVIGAIGARFMSGSYRHSVGMARPGLMLSEGRRMMRGLSKERRFEIRGIIRGHVEELRLKKKDIIQSRSALAAIIAGDPLDEEALRKAISSVNKAEMDAHASITALRADFIKALSPDERKTYAKRLRRHKRSRYK